MINREPGLFVCLCAFNCSLSHNTIPFGSCFCPFILLWRSRRIVHREGLFNRSEIEGFRVWIGFRSLSLLRHDFLTSKGTTVNIVIRSIISLASIVQSPLLVVDTLQDLGTVLSDCIKQVIMWQWIVSTNQEPGSSSSYSIPVPSNQMPGLCPN